MRGEHFSWCPGPYAVAGSSPHARGAPPVLVRGRRVAGIIPACAGSTRLSPRTAWATGSSPHARGALVSELNPYIVRGIIPACAGSTVRHQGHAPQLRDHPRMRGEHNPYTLYANPTEGSSPHARGALKNGYVYGTANGIIPACAGSTGRRYLTRCIIGDHPRMRGEHGLIGNMIGKREGSSPHARGARCYIVLTACCTGIIPACAGSTLHDQGLLRLVSLYAFTSCKFLSPERSLLSAVFPPCVIFARIAPTFRWSSNKGGILGAGGATNELQPVAINRLPIGLMHFKSQVLLVASRVHHDCPASFHKCNDALPKPFSHTRRNMAHKNARGNLKKPACQITSQAGRARRKNYHHQAASPPTVRYP